MLGPQATLPNPGNTRDRTRSYRPRSLRGPRRSRHEPARRDGVSEERAGDGGTHDRFDDRLAAQHHRPLTHPPGKAHWDRDRFRGRELFGHTVGIVGMGRLGTLVAGYFRAFGMRVLGYDPREDFPTDAAERVPRLDELLARIRRRRAAREIRRIDAAL